MNPFKGRHFQRDIILWAVRWYCKYGISYRELQEMLAERGVNVDHSTIYRWVQRYAPEMEKRLRWYWRNPSDLCPWHMDETYVKVNGRWAYLYRAVDSRGRTVDFYLSSRRNRGCKPEPPKFPSRQFHPCHKGIQINHLAVTLKGIVSVQQNVSPGCRRYLGERRERLGVTCCFALR